jgi:hypothetical protein
VEEFAAMAHAEQIFAKIAMVEEITTHAELQVEEAQILRIDV